MKTTPATATQSPGTSPDMLPLLRIRLSENWIAEFDKVDTRFNDCTNWQMVNSTEPLLFSTCMYQRFSDMKAAVIATVDACYGRPSDSDRLLAEAGKTLLAVLDRYPSFAALAKHPDRLN